VSCGRISQIRLELAARWRQFHGELPEREELASRLSGGSPPRARLDDSPQGDGKLAPIAGRVFPSAAPRGIRSASPDSAWLRS
jgi:hypothetical protein